MEIGRLACDPAHEPGHRLVRAHGLGIITDPGEFAVGEIRVDRLVADRVHRDLDLALLGAWHRVVPLDQRFKRTSAQPAGRVTRFQSSKLTERQGVAIGILEPCDLGSAGRSPDTTLVLRHEFEPLESHSTGRQFVDLRSNVIHSPTDQSKGQWREFRHLLHTQQITWLWQLCLV